MNLKRKREFDQEVPGDDWLPARKIPTQNLLCRLLMREVYPSKQNVHSSLISRHLHQNVVPRFTIIGVHKPAAFIKKFSPDGRYLFAFSSDQTCVYIFKYLGPQSGAPLIYDLPGEFTVEESVCLEAFERYFCFIRDIVVISDVSEQLNRECSLFTDDSKFLIVASAAFLQSEPTLSQVLISNESLMTTQQSPCEDYTFHLIDIERGQVCDRLAFHVDRIILTHNHGIYLFEHTLAILSLQHQTIHVFDVTPEGRFLRRYEIGRFCFPDDARLVANVEPTLDSYGTPLPAYTEACITSLKHRLLVLLYRKSSSAPDARQQLKTFCQLFGTVEQLKMVKMQLLDSDHLLIRFAKEKLLLHNRVQDTASSGGPSLFAVYQISTGELLNVYKNTSEELLSLFENFCEYFRNLPQGCSPSNNVHSRLLQQRYKQTILHARFGGQQEMVKRLLSQLPVSCQSFNASPYLDLSLFSYDDKWVSMFDRPKASGEYPIKFYNRDSGLLRYKMYTGMHMAGYPSLARQSSKRLAAFTFHPKDPFAISVQRVNGDYIVNFHVPNDNH